MNVEITSRHVHVEREVEEYAREKAGKVTKYLHHEVRVEIVVDKEHDDFIVEMLVSGQRGERVIGREKHAEPRAAVDLVIDKVEQQLRKLAGRRKDHKGESMAGENSPPPLPEGADESPDDAELSYEDIIDEELNK
ncbi:MAG: ribosome hibernation-promoting factor, HPF/YfiA family [Planctomycetota bacterium JB042]